MVYTLQFDGCCKPNPGEIGIGVIIINDRSELVLELSKKCGLGTNNQAEYQALINGLEELAKKYTGELLVQGDSQLVINQLTGEWQVKKPELLPLYARVKALENKFQSVEYQWIERKENHQADALSAKALGLNLTTRKDKRLQLKVGSSYEFVFSRDDRIETVRDERYGRDVQRYFVDSAKQDGHNIGGTYFETGSKKLNSLLDYFKPLHNKKLRIYPRKAQNWTEYLVEEVVE